MAPDPSARGETINDVSRDVSQAEVSDRRLWLAERCPACGAQPGARCKSRSKQRRKPPAMLTLHAARGWRLRPCPACNARPGEGCFTPRGRPAARPHTARVHLARRELHALEDVWRAPRALKREAGGGALHRGRRAPGNARARQHPGRRARACRLLGRGRATARQRARGPRCGAATAPSRASRRSPQHCAGASLTGR